MGNHIKTQLEILSKLKISELNAMQKKAGEVIKSSPNTILLSPTGTGKSLAFLLPLLQELDMKISEIQALILVPSRELAIQIEQVVREMGSGFKANAVYGGRSSAKDKMDLKHSPAILIGTPGRIADHLRRDNFPVHNIKTILLDEFDKSLEIGFEEEMSEIFRLLPNIEKRILTSATQNVQVPEFVGLESPAVINYLAEETHLLEVKIVNALDKDKLQGLLALLAHIGNKPGIIFCNFKNSIQFVSDFLTAHSISHGVFHGGMEQQDRERALIKFRNGTHRIIISTDLAARGLDIPELNFIIHYQLPLKEAEFTHRNGRTARMEATGTAYVLKWEKEILPEFIKDTRLEKLESNQVKKDTEWKTLFISGGRKDKISKGDIAGLFFKQGNLSTDELGTIELKQDCSFVSIPASKADELIQTLNNSRLKKKKVRIKLV
ncbi:DEAD/DEAH box helicase [Christiangramia sabulilitoris]|uniref:DEAD/DEAH box helicase n=1 Tax=Christiangramia sabulilitoris TaxID=2583991 RepID=A0A550I3K2_9FLAO|nr:DEAD/DEAH box helicase [Christiangramia sabulilitoris]TRO65529.1 DEAD/DEAH box helicase [Christiangramia sabulilitoris]